jgi:hypothetical protein
MNIGTLPVENVHGAPIESIHPLMVLADTDHAELAEFGECADQMEGDASTLAA